MEWSVLVMSLLICVSLQDTIGVVSPKNNYDRLQRRLTEMVAGKHNIYEERDLRDMELIDVPIVVVWNGKDRFAPTKPMLSRSYAELRTSLIFQQGHMLKYMLERGMRSYFTASQRAGHAAMMDVLDSHLDAFRPELEADALLYRGTPVSMGMSFSRI